MNLKNRVDEYGEDIKPNSLYRGKTAYNYTGERLLLLSTKPFLKQRLLVFWIQDRRQDRLALMMYRHSDTSV